MAEGTSHDHSVHHTWFSRGLAFPLDRFQREACDAIVRGDDVVVAAPTGSGKTIVAEYALATALRKQQRAFYTTPLKALSNQKFHDLVGLHGEEQVGLLTGDVAIHPDAPVVVMTTEVLRNMMYAASSALDDVGYVILDEVHFLQDTYRGPVWEEIIIHLERSIRLVCLSATVSNAPQLAKWMTEVRYRTAVITETTRPVPLENHYMVFDKTNERLHLFPTFVGGSLNRDALRLDESGVRHRWSGKSRRSPTGGTRKLGTPTRLEVVDALDDKAMLPAIYFIFSRRQCEEAAAMAAQAGIQLISQQEQDAIVRILDARLEDFSTDDLSALGIDGFVQQLMSGVAPHHAGMVPAFKEIVEQAFVSGLLKVVFATETLAVGVNMPASSVVIEKTTKYNGDHHVSLSAGEFTQLTGRAGRRGLDDVGHAVVLWNPFVRFSEVAELAGSSSYNLRSVFRPTFNMVANLVSRCNRGEAREMLMLSFAQYQRDHDVVRLQARLARRRTEYNDRREQSRSPFGDLDEYRSQQQKMKDSTATSSVDLSNLRPGDVVYSAVGAYRGPVVIAATAHRSNGLRLSVVTASGKLATVTSQDFVGDGSVVGTVVMPGSFTPHKKEFRQEVARRLKRAKLRPEGARHARASESHNRQSSEVHPVELDPDLKTRLRAAEDADRRAKELERLERDIASRRGSLGRDFDGVVSVMSKMGFIKEHEWVLTEDGKTLSRIFHESDLLVVEALRSGLFDGLSAAELAGLVSAIVYEYRGVDEPPPPWFPTSELQERFRRLESLSLQIDTIEGEFGLAVHRPPDAGFLAIAHGWCSGVELADLVDDGDIAGGDIVRNLRQVIDLCRQIGDVVSDPDVRTVAREAVSHCTRGVVLDIAGVDSPSVVGHANEPDVRDGN